MCQKCAYVSRKGKQMFLGLKEGVTYVKMKKPRKKKFLVFSCEAPFLFLNYLDDNGFGEQDEGGRMCVVKGKEEQLWDKLQQDLQLLHYEQVV
jgi:hypothetical protein